MSRGWGTLGSRRGQAILERQKRHKAKRSLKASLYKLSESHEERIESLKPLNPPREAIDV